MRCRIIHALVFVCTGILAADVVPAGPERTTLGDLLKVQQSVQSLLPKLRPAVVAIQTHDGTASGVIITQDGLILTAAHVAEKPGREMRVVLDDGKVVKAVTLGLDKTTDAALMQLRDSGAKWPFVKVNREVVKAQPGVWCIALGHPGGFDKQRGVVLRVGKIVRQTANSLQTDCVLMGGDSGGPLFNLAGEVIGIHSQIWEDRDQNMHVSMAPFFRSWDDMKMSRIIRVWGTGSGGYLGVNLGPADVSPVRILQVNKGSAADRARLIKDDQIVALDGEAVHTVSQFQNAVRARPAGTEIRLRIQRGAETIEIKATLTPPPKEDAG